MDASQLTNESRINAMLVGPSGSGKKAAACTFPKPLKYFDMDMRIRGLLGSDWVDRKGIDYKSYPPIKRREDVLVYQELNNDLEALMMQAQVNQMPYKTIVLGSITGEFYSLLRDATALTHQLPGKDAQGQQSGKKGKYIGAMAIADPSDYNFVYQGIRNTLSFFRSLPGVHVLVLGHTIPRYGKPVKEDGTEDTYADSIVIGAKLSLTDKAGAEIPSGFDNVWEFSKAFDGNKESFYVQFRSDIGRCTFPPTQLPNGKVDITRKNFYEYLMSKIGTQITAGAVVK